MKRRSTTATATFVALASSALLACVTASPSDLGENQDALESAATSAGLVEGSREALAVLAVVNDRALSVDDYVFKVRLARPAADALVRTRDGVNGVMESRPFPGGSATLPAGWEVGGDDEAFSRLSEVDALPGTDETAFRRLRDYALANGYASAVSTDAIVYRRLDGHRGCTVEDLPVRASGCPAINLPGGGSYSGAAIAQIPGYRCAAKSYGGAALSTASAKPLLLLVHGNSDVPLVFENTGAGNMLAERAALAGFDVLSVDLRFDRVDDPRGNNATENLAQNFDHGWAVPIAQHFIDSVMTAYPNRPISIVGFSTGVTVVRDALRRLSESNKKPFERLKDVVLAAGANHGVVNGDKLCRENPTMRGKLGCELGDRTNPTATPFLKALNGRNGEFETPCADGSTAFGRVGACGGHKVRYTTIVMKDENDAVGQLRDEFVSEASARLQGAKNLTVTAQSRDTSNYFCNGAFSDHYGALRSESALSAILDALSAPPN